MSENEYLELFSKTGNIKVQVEFKNFSGSVTSLRMNAEDILKLISPIDGQFISRMSFDEWPFEVHKYEINPLENMLTIHARPFAKNIG